MGNNSHTHIVHHSAEVEQARPWLKAMARLGLEQMNDPYYTFWTLAHYTCPHGYERAMYGDLLTGLGAIWDTKDNAFIFVEDSTGVGRDDTLFVCHMDTADAGIPKRVHYLKGEDKDNRNILVSDGTTILGADDKAGMTVLLYLISQGVPGAYAFFVGEEKGLIGSTHVAGEEWLKVYKRAIAFDRRGFGSVITHQAGGIRCCSDKFAEALAAELNTPLTINGPKASYKKDDGGSITDSHKLRGAIAECTNLSVGYHSQHTNNESQDVSHLEWLCLKAADIKWWELPTERIPAINTVSDFRAVGGTEYGKAYYSYSTPITDKTFWELYSPSGKRIYQSDIPVPSPAIWDYLPFGAAQAMMGLHNSMGKRQEAKDYYKQVEQIAFSYPDVATDLIMSLIRHMRYDEAREAIETWWAVQEVQYETEDDQRKKDSSGDGGPGEAAESAGRGIFGLSGRRSAYRQANAPKHRKRRKVTKRTRGTPPGRRDGGTE